MLRQHGFSLLILAILLPGAAVHAEQISADLHGNPGDTVNVIVQFNEPNVLYISPDRPVHGQLDLTAAALNAPIARQYGWNGNGVGIAIIGSGISADLYGHGTHVAGIAAGSGAASGGKYQGIAPAAPLRVINLSPGRPVFESHLVAPGNRAVSTMGAGSHYLSVWSDSSSQSCSVVWGDLVVWGDSAVWGDSVVWGDTLSRQRNDWLLAT